MTYTERAKKQEKSLFRQQSFSLRNDCPDLSGYSEMWLTRGDNFISSLQDTDLITFHHLETQQAS